MNKGGPPGQTDPYRMAPLTRRPHRLKTHARGWVHLNPSPGVYLWRTRYGYWFRVDPDGTHALSREPDLLAHGVDPADPHVFHREAVHRCSVSAGERIFADLVLEHARVN